VAHSCFSGTCFQHALTVACRRRVSEALSHSAGVPLYLGCVSLCVCACLCVSSCRDVAGLAMAACVRVGKAVAGTATRHSLAAGTVGGCTARLCGFILLQRAQPLWPQPEAVRACGDWPGAPVSVTQACRVRICCAAPKKRESTVCSAAR